MAGIIVGIDGSVPAQRALEWAVREAAVHAAPLTVITVCRTASNMWTGGPVSYPVPDQAAADKAKATAEEATDKALALAGEVQPATVSVVAVAGIPAEELITASKYADMIVLGSRGGGGFARLLLGSVSTQVVHHGHCPVVIIPTEDRP